MWLYGQEFITVSYYTVKIEGHRHCTVVVEMFLVYHMISQDHLIKRVMWLYEWEPLMVIHHPAKFGDYKDGGSGI